MAPNVMTVTRDELVARRDALLARTGLTRQQLQERAEAYSLNAEEWDILTELEHIDFLLG